MIQEQKFKSKESISQFKNRDEEVKFWETHDIADYWHDFVPVDIELAKPKEENIIVRLQKPIKDRLERIARQKGLNFSSLTRMWITEKLQTAHR